MTSTARRGRPMPGLASPAGGQAQPEPLFDVH